MGSGQVPRNLVPIQLNTSSRISPKRIKKRKRMKRIKMKMKMMMKSMLLPRSPPLIMIQGKFME